MRCLFSLFARFALIGNLPAQVSTATITGIVTDSGGRSIPAVEVLITYENTAVDRTLTTQTSGAYVARRLALGNYRGEARYAGFQPEAKTGIVSTIDQTPTLDFTLHPGDQTEVVTVVGRAEQMGEAAASS